MAPQTASGSRLILALVGEEDVVSRAYGSCLDRTTFNRASPADGSASAPTEIPLVGASARALHWAFRGDLCRQPGSLFP